MGSGLDWIGYLRPDQFLDQLTVIIKWFPYVVNLINISTSILMTCKKCSINFLRYFSLMISKLLGHFPSLSLLTGPSPPQAWKTLMGSLCRGSRVRKLYPIHVFSHKTETRLTFMKYWRMAAYMERLLWLNKFLWRWESGQGTEEAGVLSPNCSSSKQLSKVVSLGCR